MSVAVALRLRRYLIILASAVFAGALGELLLIGHYTSALQIAPVVGVILGLVTTGAFLMRLREVAAHPGEQRVVIRVFRAVMALLVALSVAGIVLHLRENYLFVREISPATGAGDAFLQAFTGASPLLASGIIAVASTCGLMATAGLKTS